MNLNSVKNAAFEQGEQHMNNTKILQSVKQTLFVHHLELLDPRMIFSDSRQLIVFNCRTIYDS